MRKNLELRTNKQNLRTQMMATCQKLFNKERQRLGDKALKNLLKSKEFLRAERIGLFASDSWELPTKPIFGASLNLDKEVAFPLVYGKELVFKWVKDWKSLRPGFKELLEPLKGIEVAIEELELLLVPGLAFDQKGNRLGRGGGFYDRLLSRQLKPKNICGLCYHFQIVSEVPMDIQDKPVQMVLTDENVFRV